MGQGGISHLTARRRTLGQLGGQGRGFPVSASVRGPLLTLAASILFDSLVRYGLVIPTPFPVMILTVVYAAASGGLGPAVVSALITTLYAIHFFSEQVGRLRYDVPGITGLVSASGAAWVAAVVVSRWARPGSDPGDARMTRDDADAIRRRLSLLEQASAILSSSLDYHNTLGHLARLLVPGWADWCTIHLVGEGGVFRFVAGAHREPGREPAVRALADYGNRTLPFGAPGQAADLCPIDDVWLRAQAQDDEHLRLYRALAPATALRVPIAVRGGAMGLLTLVIAESGRRIGADEVEVAEELAERCSLALEGAMLRREARDAARRFELCFAANPQPMWLFDVETLGFLLVNDAAVRQYGYAADELASMTIMDLLPRHETSPPLAPGEAGEARSGVARARHQRKDGSVVEVELWSQELELNGRRARLVVATDVTERTRTVASLHRSEDHLRHAQRMDLVGRLGIGVAHDFNNVLTTIRGYSDILARELATDDPCRAGVERIVHAADQGMLLARQLLAFGLRQPFHPSRVSLTALIQGMEGLIGRLAGDDIEVRTRLSDDVGMVCVDASRIEQAVVSLVLTARDAMPTGGALTIETSDRWMSGFPTGQHGKDGQYVVLAISDTGGGPGSEAPTRPLDRRSTEGLGLRVVSSIVRQSRGIVRVSSEADPGRTVRIYLPVVREPRGSPRSGAAPRGIETVLVVEDEGGVRQLVVRMLSDAGYHVLQAGDAREALLTADRYDGSIHLLITDVVMPEMNGGDLARALVERRPDLEVLYISGYADAEILHRGVRRPEDSLLTKPFTADELLRLARALLDKRST